MGKRNRNNSPFIYFRLYVDRALMETDDFFDKRKPDAVAFYVRAVCAASKGLKYIFQFLCGDANSLVGKDHRKPVMVRGQVNLRFVILRKFAAILKQVDYGRLY